MAAVNGNCVTLHVGTGTTAPTTITGTAIAGVTSASISLSNATFEVTSIDDPDNCDTTRDFAVGTTSGSASIEGVVDEDLANDGSVLFTYFNDKTQITVCWSDGTNGVCFTGFCTGFEISAGMDDFATFSASFEMTGLPNFV